MSSPPQDLSGVVAIVKSECPTCVLVTPVLAELARKTELTVYSQDDPGFPPGIDARDDRSLEISVRYDIEFVPTLLRIENGAEVERSAGWHRQEWERLAGIEGLGPGLPASRPG